MSVADGKDMDVDVSIGEVAVAIAATGFVSSVTDAVAGAVLVSWTITEAAVTGTCAGFGLLRKRKKRINRMIATINLKRS